MAAVTSTPSKGALQLRLDRRELPVSPPTSPGFDDDEKAKAARTPAASAGSARCDDLDEISGAIEEARRRNAPVGILLSLAKKLSVARQRASTAKPTTKMRTMQLEMEALPPSSDAGDEAAGWRSPRSIQRELDRELRFCSEAIAEAEWVRDFGDAAIAEAERLHAERHDEYTRETAVLTIQDAWRRRKAPALADNQKLPFVPGPTYLEAEAASRIQSAVRGKLTRLALAAELELMEELGSPSPRWTGPLADLEEADTFADVCAAGTKLVLVVGAVHAVVAAVCFEAYSRYY